jgi:putative flippase GtrA
MVDAPRSLFGQLLAYALGGGAMTALHSLSYWLMAEPLGVEPYVANSLAAVLAGLAGYALHSRFTFGHERDTGGEARAFGRYVIVSILCYLLNSFWVWLVVKQWGMSVAASIVPMILLTPWLGFVLNRFWAFRRP